MRNKKLLFFTLFIVSAFLSRAQKFDIGLHFFNVKQDGTILQTINTPGVYSPYSYTSDVNCVGGHFGVYQPFVFHKNGTFSAGAESGLYFAYSRKNSVIDQDYMDLKDSMPGILRSIGAVDFPLMASIRSGRFSGGLKMNGRSFGLSGGLHIIYFYVSNERGTFISPGFSAMVGLTKRIFFRFDYFTRSYSSEYVTTLGTLPRLTSRFRAFSFNVAL